MTDGAGKWVLAAGLSDVGCVRESNQDAWTVDRELGLLVLADGMGGRAAGETASRAVVEILPRMIRQQAGKTASVEDVLECAIVELSRRMYESSRGQAGVSGMGSTVIACWIDRGRGVVGHLGDSRLYRWSEKRLSLLTSDHTFGRALTHEGMLEESGVAESSLKGALSQYVGMELTAAPDVVTIELQLGDRLLLCSDGLTNMMSDDEIQQILSDQSDPSLACQELVSGAKAAGGTDNITVLVADIRQSEPEGEESAAGRDGR